MIIAAREKCLSHDRDWMKKGISKRKNAQVCISQYLVWYEDLEEEYALEVKKNINYRNRWHVINKTSLY